MQDGPRDGLPTGLRRLPGSGEEVRRIGKIMRAAPGELLTGASASEAAVKAASAAGELAKYRYVHFATHGLLGYGDDVQPGLVLSLRGDLGGEDGLLRLDEIADLRLNADLVVLSACRTGRGQLYSGEGVRGIARAFITAGGRAVLASLWPVYDARTAEVMEQYYAELERGVTPSEALRTVQGECIRKGEPPLVWAPFVLIGR
jgi:CHAT domain-containing protein